MDSGLLCQRSFGSRSCGKWRRSKRGAILRPRQPLGNPIPGTHMSTSCTPCGGRCFNCRRGQSSRRGFRVLLVGWPKMRTGERCSDPLPGNDSKELSFISISSWSTSPHYCWAEKTHCPWNAPSRRAAQNWTSPSRREKHLPWRSVEDWSRIQ